MKVYFPRRVEVDVATFLRRVATRSGHRFSKAWHLGFGRYSIIVMTHDIQQKASNP